MGWLPFYLNLCISLLMLEIKQSLTPECNEAAFRGIWPQVRVCICTFGKHHPLSLTLLSATARRLNPRQMDNSDAINGKKTDPFKTGFGATSDRHIDPRARTFGQDRG